MCNGLLEASGHEEIASAWRGERIERIGAVAGIHLVAFLAEELELSVEGSSVGRTPLLETPRIVFLSIILIYLFFYVESRQVNHTVLSFLCTFAIIPILHPHLIPFVLGSGKNDALMIFFEVRINSGNSCIKRS